MALSEIVQFLSQGQREDLKSAACKNVSQLTGSSEGLELVYKEVPLLEALMALAQDPNSAIATDALKAIVNISAEEKGASTLLSLSNLEAITELLKVVKDKECGHADLACAALANMSRFLLLCPKVFERIENGPTKLGEILHILCHTDYNNKGATLDLLAAVIQNITQIPEGHRAILDPKSHYLEQLLPFTTYSKSRERRKCIVAAIHNCCFEKEHHLRLLSEEIDIAPRLLLPLTGPDVFSEEENKSLPLDLQYLPDDKTREDDPAIRTLLLQCLMQLCATRTCRKLLREMNVYLVLREHHKWETDIKCKVLNEDLVNILIRTEDEIGEEDLTSIDVPQEMSKKFALFDEEFLRENT